MGGVDGFVCPVNALIDVSESVCSFHNGIMANGFFSEACCTFCGEFVSFSRGLSDLFSELFFSHVWIIEVERDSVSCF